MEDDPTSSRRTAATHQNTLNINYMENNISLFCDRCSCVVNPGQGEHYVIRIEAIADPTPPIIIDEDGNDSEQIGQRLTALFESLKDLTEQEAMDQVFRRVVLQLCNTCYAEWIENPTNT